jgi:Flp pilus assembly pilin Flp
MTYIFIVLLPPLPRVARAVPGVRGRRRPVTRGASPRLSSTRNLCELKTMAIFRDAAAPLIRLFDRERGQSLTEYTLILALLAVAVIAVLGMVSPPISGRLDAVTSALGGESEGSAFAGLHMLPLWIAIGVLAIGAVGVYLLRIRRG